MRNVEAVNINKNLAIYAITHFLIDATTIAALFYCFREANFPILLVAYNLLAFGLQPLFGFVCDVLRKPVSAAVLGCLISGVSILLTSTPIIAICLAGIGNALYHVGGGTISLNLRPGKASMPGLFVAPGALGVLVGTLFGKNNQDIKLVLLVFLAAAIIMILKSKAPEINYKTPSNSSYCLFEIIMVLLLISVSIRSMIGLALDFPWKSNIYLLVMLTVSVFLGKAIGGVLSDRFGYTKVTVTGLAVSAFLISFGMNMPPLAISGVLLFNMTMPVTLIMVSNILPGKPGFAFGLTAFFLLIGAFPTFTPIRAILYNQWIILFIVLMSAIMLYWALSFIMTKTN